MFRLASLLPLGRLAVLDHAGGDSFADQLSDDIATLAPRALGAPMRVAGVPADGLIWPHPCACVAWLSCSPRGPNHRPCRRPPCRLCATISRRAHRRL